MKAKITIVGASSPFILGLINGLAENPMVTMDIVLQGTNQQCLALVLLYTRNLLESKGWRISATTSVTKAMEAADIVIHQPRYGGIIGRIADEELAEHANVVADETLGPGGLQAALRMAPYLREFAECVRRVAPMTWVVNLTNPLSLSCSILAESGIERVVGVCELPQETADSFLHVCGLHPKDWSWHITGLNHRSFIHSLSTTNRIYSFKEITDKLSNDKAVVGGIPLTKASEWNVLPTKYFRFFCGSDDRGYGRACIVRSIKKEALAQLETRPNEFPSALLARPTPWYSAAVVPLVRALIQDTNSVLVVNTVGYDGITREVHARVSPTGISTLPAPNAPIFAKEWTQKYLNHEDLMLNACRTESFHDILKALIADPLIPAEKARDIATTIYDNRRKQS